MPMNLRKGSSNSSPPVAGGIEPLRESAGNTPSNVLEAVNPLKALKSFVGNLEAEDAARLISTASDFALIVDSEGVIKDLSSSSPDLPKEGLASWIGRPWIETVTSESRSKVAEMIHSASSASAPRWRQVNHMLPHADELPVRYSAIEIGRRKNIIALGRDLRPMAEMQQRLIEAQQSTEREYARLRNAETRYRALFQLASEPILIVDASTLKVIEANPAATDVLDKPVKKVVGRPLADIFHANSLGDLQQQISDVRAAGQIGGIKLRLPGGPECMVSVSLFRQGIASHFLVRLTPLGASMRHQKDATGRSKVMDVVQNMPDGFVVTGEDFKVIAVNSAFIELTQLAIEEQVKGQSIERWIGRTSSEFGLMMANLREHAALRNFATVFRGELGSQEEVELSAVSVESGDQPCHGFIVRTVGRRSAPARSTIHEFPRSMNQLTSLVGSVPLKELVRETTDLIERLCIEAALDLADDNRVSAAEMLGVSRQSLYMKLRRYGIGERGSDDAQSIS
jgi:transcriptional regulator PpsR